MSTRESNLVELACLLGTKALKMQAIARSLHRLQEASCNVSLTPGQEKRLDRLVAEAEALAKQAGLILYYQSDPRGWPLYLLRPDQIAGSLDSCYDRGIAVYPR